MRFRLQLSKHELLFHIVSIILLTFILGYPLYRQCVTRPPGSVCVYSYGSWTDYFTYVSYIRQGSMYISPINQYTTENMPPLSTHWFYGAIGAIGSAFKLHPIVIFHGSIYLSFLLYYAFATLLVRHFLMGNYRYIAFFVVFFSGPFPPLLFSLGKESFTFTAIHWWTKMDPYWRHFQIPHHIFGLALMVATVYFLLRFLREKNFKWCIAATFLQGIGTQVFPVPGTVVLIAYVLIILFLVLTSFTRAKLKNIRVVNKQLIVGTALFTIVSILSIILTFQRLSSLNHYLDTLKWEYETFHQEIEPYTFSNFIYSYGLLPLFFIVALPGILSRKRSQEVFLSLCFILPILFYVISLLEFFHMNKLRMIYTAPYVYGGILATIGIKDFIHTIHRRIVKRFVFSFLVVILLLNSIVTLKSHWVPWLTTLPIFLHTYPQKPYMDMAKYLDANLPVFTPVFTYYELGILLPAFSYVKVFNGHDTATMDGWNKDLITKDFYAKKLSEDQARIVLKKYQIEYVIWDNSNTPYLFLDNIVSFDYVGLYKVRG